MIGGTYPEVSRRLTYSQWYDLIHQAESDSPVLAASARDQLRKAAYPPPASPPSTGRHMEWLVKASMSSDRQLARDAQGELAQVQKAAIAASQRLSRRPVAPEEVVKSPDVLLKRAKAVVAGARALPPSKGRKRLLNQAGKVQKRLQR